MKCGTAGHFNFSIQDGVSRLDAVLFAEEARRVTTLPEDGQVFVFRGRIDFFGKTGRLSFIVDQVEFDDVGKLRARLEELKRRLEAEGAFADVIVIARGGGSFEELYGFNSEVVARAILASRLPVVTALGHTSDRTVADLVADAECRTPTEAGARVVPKKSDLVTLLRERG